MRTKRKKSLNLKKRIKKTTSSQRTKKKIFKGKNVFNKSKISFDSFCVFFCLRGEAIPEKPQANGKNENDEADENE